MSQFQERMAVGLHSRPAQKQAEFYFTCETTNTVSNINKTLSLTHTPSIVSKIGHLRVLWLRLLLLSTDGQRRKSAHGRRKRDHNVLFLRRARRQFVYPWGGTTLQSKQHAQQNLGEQEELATLSWLWLKKVFSFYYCFNFIVASSGLYSVVKLTVDLASCLSRLHSRWGRNTSRSNGSTKDCSCPERDFSRSSTSP